MSEATIRDHLAANLSLIEPGLTLIDDEYHLRNPNGARGFIDIFAKDSSGSLVVIEVKKTDGASRQAITELAKYAALLKLHKKIRGSELRLLIVSAAWHELLVPFSEFYHSTDYRIEAFRVDIDSKDIPQGIHRVEPLPPLETRNICRRHLIWWFSNPDYVKNVKRTLNEYFARVGIHDYLLVSGSFLNIEGQLMHFLYFAQQRKGKEFYFRWIQDNFDPEIADEMINNLLDLEDEDDIIDEAADHVLIPLDEDRSIDCEWVEISHPEKFVTLLDAERLGNFSIEKFGSFSNDERLSDDLLLEDLKGTTGASTVWYSSTFSGDNRAKMSEVKDAIENSLYFTSEWRHAIRDILEHAERSRFSFTAISVFNPDNIIEAIFAASKNQNSDLLPNFQILIEYQEEERAELFKGSLAWNGTDCTLESLIKKSFRGSQSDFLFSALLESHGDKTPKMLETLGFFYRVDLTTFTDIGERTVYDISFRGRRIHEGPNRHQLTMEDFLNAGTNIQTEIVKMYTSHYIF